jgi:hypothetical protein
MLGDLLGGMIPLDTLSSHGSALKTVVSRHQLINTMMAWNAQTNLPQNPVSRPTEKQLLSLLKVAERDTGPSEISITCRVFMVASTSYIIIAISF